MKQFRAIVNHTGICEGHYFWKDKEVTLPESVIKALGINVRVLDEIKEEEEEEKAITQPPFDKMIKAPMRSK